METEGEIKKGCPSCGKDLMVRTNSKTGEDFLGCTEYPTCTHTEPLPMDIIMLRKGAQRMDGF